jgi:hypothetical protein
MICTQVVAVMPPKVTYTIISTPTHEHRRVVFQTEQQLDQLAGTNHLDDQVEADDGQRTDGREGADTVLVER